MWKILNDKYNKPPPEVAAADAYWAEQRKKEADYYARMYDPNYGKHTQTPTYPANPNAPAQPQAYDPQADALAKYFGVSLADSEINAEGATTLTVEEQREVALKVVFGIFGLLAAGLLVGFIYNQLTAAAKPAPTRQRQTGEEFLVEEIAPNGAPTNSTSEMQC